jgi:bifunctional oligoribonuclease and PAP phosphatase NrnA
MTQSKLQWAEATQAVEQAQSILLVTHIFPDGDAVGSLVALATALSQNGKTVDTAIDGGVPDVFDFIPGTEQVKNKLTIGSWDLLISLDASDEKRTGSVGEYGRTHSQTVINLDHHATNIFFGDIFLVMVEAVSATEVVYDWMQFMQQPLPREVAVPLLTGLVTDTLGFRTSNVTAKTLSIAQALMEAGASLTEVTARTLDSKSYRVVKLWKEVLPSVTLDGTVISATVTREDMKKAGLVDASDGGLVGFLIKVNEAMIAAVFRETDNGQVELSFRSKRGYDVAQVAFSLDGGGHTQAAGATISGPLEKAKKRVMPMLKQASRLGKLEIV